MQKLRTRVGGRSKGRRKGRVTDRRMRWIIDERQSRDKGLDVTWWDWLSGQDLWESAAGSDARTCGVGVEWDSGRRCCPVPWNLGSLTCL